MNLTAKKEALKKLRAFVLYLVSCGIKTSQEYRDWAREPAQARLLVDYFDSDSQTSLCTLVNVFFHPDVDLIGLNYTQVAHNTLYKSQTGWTNPIRLCRGIVFNSKGALVCLPYEKFFNFGEHPETRNLPGGEFTTLIKEDGHMGEIFTYQRRLYITSRGSFVSPTAKLAQELLVHYASKNDWKRRLPSRVCPIVEIIHPSTKVIVDYEGQEKFILTGAFDRKTLHDYEYHELQELGKLLGLPVVEQWVCRSIDEVKEWIKNRDVTNREGFVVRFGNGLRVKFKYETYLKEMIKAKLSLPYILNQALNGSLTGKAMLLDTDFELSGYVIGILARVMAILAQPAKSLREKWNKLYELLAEGEDTPYAKEVCRQFVKRVCSACQEGG